MKNIIRCCFVIVLLSWSYQIKTQQVMLMTAIVGRDIDQVRKYLDEGGDVNLVFRDNKNSMNLLQYSIVLGAEEIAEMLIKKGADLKYLAKNDGDEMTALGLASGSRKISANLVKTVLTYGADIDNLLRAKKLLSGTKSRSLFSVVGSDDLDPVQKQKQDFVIYFLMELYQKKLLEIALEKEIEVANIAPFVENGAYISPTIAQKAIEKQKDKEVIQFLQYQVDTQEALPQLLPFNRDVCLLVASYAQGRLDGDKVEKNNSPERCIVM